MNDDVERTLTDSLRNVVHEIARMSYDLGQTGVLAIWTVTQNPRDFPGQCAARLWHVQPGNAKATSIVLVADVEEDISQVLSEAGLVPMAPWPGDDPVIIRIWM